jgi:alpha-maltose-1-phosphate synthase
MRVSLITIMRFHIFELARQLLKDNHLSHVYTAYPRNRVDTDLLPHSSSYPYFLYPAMGLTYARLDQTFIYNQLNKVAHRTLQQWAAKKMAARNWDTDILVALSKSGLHAFTAAKKRGVKVVCDRGSAHIVYQDEILAEEFAKQGLPYQPIPKWAIQDELDEYAMADLITVPSYFAYKSFIDKGMAPEKVAIVPYGVNLTEFKPMPKTDDVFRVLFVGTASIQKGVVYLLEALAGLKLPKFEVALLGGSSPDADKVLKKYEGSYKFLGFVPRLEVYRYMSNASVLVHPSLQEGLALVQAQAMACGLPVIASTNTGAEHTLFSDGVEGFIVPIRDPDAIRERVLQLYHNPDLQKQMAAAALARVQQIGGWDDYGSKAVAAYKKLLGR